MLKELRLKNFRRHQDRTVKFTPGLNVIRGENEAGKSTIEEALLYVFFGSRLLRTSLENTVTWGMEPKTLKAELDFSSGFTVYTFRRSKAGAEVLIGSEVHVTGQAEVTAFAVNLLGVDAKLAQVLMFAGQDSLRGALDDGPTAVSGLIGRLADFDAIDKLMRRGEETLSTGPSKVLTDRLRQAEEARDKAQAALVPAEHLEALDRLVAGLTTEADTLASQERAARAAVTELSQRHDLVAQAHREHELRAAGLPALRQRLQDLQAEVERAKGVLAQPGATAEDLAHAERAVADAVQVQEQRRAWVALQKACAAVHEDGVFEGDRAALDAEITRVAAEVTSLRAEAAAARGEARGLRRLDGSKCPTCGAERVDAAHVERHNAEITQKEEALLARAKEVDSSAEEYTTYLRALQEALTVDHAIVSALAGWPENLDQPVVDATRTPRKVTLPAEPVAEPVDTLRRRVSEITRERIRQEEAQGALDRAERQISFTHLDLQSTESILATASLPDLQQSKEALAAARASLDALTVRLRDVSTQVANAKVEASTLRARGEAAVSTLAQAEQRITDIRADLEALAFGNGLMDKLRKLKPAVTDHLWSLTLTAVSASFSQTRGEDSIVTKDSSGFCINGEPLSSYSGSTKDALAIAIRVALTKTFLPAAPFVTLDEPAHGASDERTGRILGFLAHAGIDQVVIASHDPLSESVADNLIYL